jgi:hypothetical protein
MDAGVVEGIARSGGVDSSNEKYHSIPAQKSNRRPQALIAWACGL